MLVKKGSLVFLTQTLNSTNIAIDQSGSAQYSDMIWGTNLQQINATSNYRFYLTTISNFTVYQTNLLISHAKKTYRYYEFDGQIKVYLNKIHNAGWSGYSKSALMTMLNSLMIASTDTFESKYVVISSNKSIIPVTELTICM